MATDALASLSSAPSYALDQLAARWELPHFIFHDHLDSTQNLARSLMDAGTAAWTLVATDHQTAGRGQHGRSWFSEPGGSLMFSLVLRPRSLEEAALLPIRIGMAVALALDNVLVERVRVMLKWPNDLILADGKIGGILCESQIRNDEAGVIAGVGLNIRSFALELDDRGDIPPAFLEPYLTAGTDRLNLLEAIVRSLRRHLNGTTGLLTSKELRIFAERDWLRGRLLHAPTQGEAAGITHDGHLRLRTSDGSIRTITTGRVGLATRSADRENA